MASSSNSISRTYDAFLSFRGEDTRRNFTDHLYSALVAYGVHTFRDEEQLQKGGDIASDLPKAIEESSIFVVVFSKNYAQSRWCLNELVKIMECATQTQRESRVLPVFYHVDPSDVRKQSASFGDAFNDHEKDADEEKKEMIQKWRIALKKAADLSGYHVNNQIYEAEVVKEIREVIIKILNRKPLYVGDNIVGMDSHLKQLESKIKIELNEVRIIGIYGIGGIGKTTIAMAIYNKFSSQFDGSSFLRDVGGKAKGSMLKLQRKLLQDVLKGEMPKLSDINEGINMIKERLYSKRVLIILDDVDELEQLENLVVNHCSYGAKSRIIITTKDTQLLAIHGVDALHEVEQLTHEEAIELFNWCAFKQNNPNPTKDFESLSNDVVKYAGGLPIALKVLGQFLYGRTISEWRSALHQLEKIPRNEVQSVLKVSYDRLQACEKEIFLDIACFFRGRDKNFVLRILGDEAEIGIKVLHDRCLISISKNQLEMHDLIQRMAQEIVRQQCPKEPGGRSRLWDFNEIDSVLTRNTGTEEIEGLFVEISTVNQIEFTKKAFKKMKRLRLLKVHQDTEWFRLLEVLDDKYKVKTKSPKSIMGFDLIQLLKGPLPQDFKFPSCELRYLHWDGYSLESLPTNFVARNLIELTLRCSNIKHLLREKKLDKLKVLNISYSLNLIGLPDFSSMQNLEILILEGCINLENLPSDFCKLKSLQMLSCLGCSKLNSFPEIEGNMGELRTLQLARTGITEVPSSIGLANGLEFLDLTYCKLMSVSQSIWNLSSLKTLFIGVLPKPNKLELDIGRLQCVNKVILWGISCEWGCLSGLCSLKQLCVKQCNLKQGVIQSGNYLSSLKELDISNCNLMEGEILNHICQLSSLELLCLSGNDFSRIPDSISQLSNLGSLDLSQCKKLAQIPKLPPRLRLLYASDLTCTSSAPLLSLFTCFSLEVIERAFVRRWRDSFSFVYSGPGTCVVVSGRSGIPGWVGHKKEGCDIGIKLPQNWYNNDDLLGFIIYGVHLLPRDEVGNLLTGHCSCRLYLTGTDDYAEVDHLFVAYKGEIGDELDLGWVIFYPKAAIKDKFFSDQWTHFAAIFERTTVDKCGIYLIGGHCLDCQQNVESSRKLCLRGNASSELPIIDYPSEFDSLCLRDCQNLEALPTHIFNFKSLTSLFCSGASQLSRFPEIPEIMGNLRALHLDGTALQQLPSSIERLQGLQILVLENCKNLVNLPETICNLSFLQILILSFCSKLEKLPNNLGKLECLEHLGVAGLDWNLIQGATRSDFGYPSSSEALNLSMNRFSSILPAITQLSNLRILELSHCQKLLQIPELPLSLRILDVHNCKHLETLSSPSSLLGFSLLKCFKSAIQDFESGSHQSQTLDVVIPGSSGIPEWIRHQKNGCDLIIQLPMNWYQNNNLMGFALYSVYAPVGNEFREHPVTLECELNFHGHHSGFSSKVWRVDNLTLEFGYSCCHGVESKKLWVTYYPKVAIEHKYHSNKWRQLKASFTALLDHKPVKVEECGFHLIYVPDVIIDTNIPRYVNSNDSTCSEDTGYSDDNHSEND